MNRVPFFNSIEQRLSFLAYRLEIRGGLNILDLHLHSEDFYLHFLNLLYGWNLKNLNIVDQNAAAIDLIDHDSKIIIQVSATATKQKVEAALCKDLSKYSTYHFKFISISKDADGLRKGRFSNPHKLKFSPADDIYDISTILRKIKADNVEEQQKVSEFLEKELKCEAPRTASESNLASIITTLSKENWNSSHDAFQTKPFEIDDKILVNQLDRAKTVIDDYKTHHARVDQIYTEFDKLGANKSLSVLNGIRTEYLALSKDKISADDCFFSIVKRLCSKIRESGNYNQMPDEELELNVGILVVDAFIRCKAFKNPSEVKNARA